jgi:hypothetical protein
MLKMWTFQYLLTANKGDIAITVLKRRMMGFLEFILDIYVYEPNQVETHAEDGAWH